MIFRSEASRKYKEAKQASILLHKLYFYLESNRMLKVEKAIHPIEQKEYKTASISQDFADSKEWNYLINLLKRNKYSALLSLYQISEKLGDKFLKKTNEIRSELPLTRENLSQHLEHHMKCIESNKNYINKDRVERLFKLIEEIRIGLINMLILNIHYI